MDKFKTRPRKPLLIDMDDTLFKTTEHVLRVVRRHFNVPSDIKIKSKEYFWKDIGEAFGVTQRYFEDMLKTPNFFNSITIDRDGYQVVSLLKELDIPFGFLTAPQYHGYCLEEKIASLDAYFPWFKPKEHLFMAWNKKFFDGILIDDNPDHSPDILFPQLYNSTVELARDSSTIRIASWSDLPHTLFLLGYLEEVEFEAFRNLAHIGKLDGFRGGEHTWPLQ